MPEKIFLTQQQLDRDAIELGKQVLESGFRPTSIIALWRSGVPFGIAIQEFLDYFTDCKADHISIRTSSYSGIDNQSREIRIHGLSYLIKTLNRDDSVLIVDDVFDSGRTIDELIRTLHAKCRSNTPQDIRIAVPWYKPEKNQTDRVPDYYLHTTDRWLKFPFSLEALNVEEIRTNRPEIYSIIEPALVELKSN
jgi:hypoxanthine phosphoribosyltransferase